MSENRSARRSGLHRQPLIERREVEDRPSGELNGPARHVGAPPGPRREATVAFDVGFRLTHADRGVGDLAGGARVLALDADRMRALLEEARVVNDRSKRRRCSDDLA